MNVSRETYDWPGEWRTHLRDMIAAGSIPFPPDAVPKLIAFAEAILAENPILNLVSHKEPQREVVKQIIDSGTISSCFSLLPGCRLLDVGSGAGFPGVVLKLTFPEIELISLDSSPKKIAFQKKVCSRLGIDATFIEGDFRRADLPAPVDLVIVKALGSHANVVRKSRGWLRPMGALVFMEGTSPDPSIDRAAAKYDDLTAALTLPYSVSEFESERHLSIVYKK
ncbi:MAG: class I SAM-dependent methyltransferase [candidate division Zixibacteria bacterium]|nr:class I SAM-dependent methyltransferase [candidate division Zixibacteria bacterium]MBU1470158.1 class I SAM-dependent methyltransferase [candidate division Zixibacteria bacterium]MBU2625999.1 class I SAM-dependent methyltransferase [candidate division Zixibacteria bacterium]